jgi:hypothetical protein
VIYRPTSVRKQLKQSTSAAGTRAATFDPLSPKPRVLLKELLPLAAAA